MSADPLRAAAEDIRVRHQPNEWDSCVACRGIWPCESELLAELVLTRAALAQPEDDTEKCEDCGHSPKHHLSIWGCYCGCKERFVALAQPVLDSPPYTGDVPAGTIDYDPASGEYVHTQRLGPDEYGASMLLARFASRLRDQGATKP